MFISEEVCKGVRTLAGEATGVSKWDKVVCTIRSRKVLGTNKLWGKAEEGLDH